MQCAISHADIMWKPSIMYVTPVSNCSLPQVVPIRQCDNGLTQPLPGQVFIFATSSYCVRPMSMHDGSGQQAEFVEMAVCQFVRDVLQPRG